MKRILLVENSPTQACTFAMMLENEGLQFVSATSGAEALERLRQEPFDLLLASLTLPDQSGIDLCRSVKLASEFGPMLVIVLSSSAELLNILKSLEAGVDGYIVGDDPELKVAKVRQILDRGLPTESSESTDITFRGQKYTLAGSHKQILNVMLSAIDDVWPANAQQTDSNQQLELELKHLRQTANKLRESEKLYHSLVEKVPVAMFRKDLDGRFTFANQLFCHDLGCTPANVIGKTDFDFFPDELAQKYRRNDQAVIEQDRLFDDVEQHHTPDGRRIFVHVMKFPVRDDNGHISGVQAVFWDVTNQTLADEELPDEIPPDLD